MMSSLKLRSMKSQQESEQALTAARLPTKKESWMVTIATVWFFSGLFLDGWAHNHVPELETFFTPWHAVFYSGYFVTALTFIIIVYRNAKRMGTTFRKAIPLGYEYAVLGIPLFLLGGIGDLLWHEVFGVEADIEALLSPTHLVLAVSMFLLVSANIRTWFRTTPPIGKPQLLDQLPQLISFSMSIGMISFMTQFSHFVSLRTHSTSQAVQSMAITGYLFHTIVLVGGMLFLLRRGRIATGGLTVAIILTLVPMAIMRDGMMFVPLFILMGVIGDVFATKLYPFEQRRFHVRAFSFFFPTIFFVGYFFTAYVVEGITWSVHLWSGSAVMSGLTGLLTSVLLLPPTEEMER